MTVDQIEALPKVRQAAKVLRDLEGRGLVEPAIASGWTRSLLTDSTTKDIDVAYVGSVHYEEAQHHLRAVLAKNGFDPRPWDINGIWNAQMAYGVAHTVDNYLLYYVDSIDTVYLASDGKLHDPTGLGFADAQAGILRINQYDRQHGRMPTPSEEVNICLEGCRRIAQVGWKPTVKSRQRIAAGATYWAKLTEKEKGYFTNKLANKYEPGQREAARVIYEQLGWGFIFDEPPGPAMPVHAGPR